MVTRRKPQQRKLVINEKENQTQTRDEAKVQRPTGK